MNESKGLLSVSVKSFLSVLLILTLLVIASGLLTTFVPAGAFARDLEGSVIPGTFQLLGDASPYPVWRWFTAPVEVLFGPDAINVIAISVFLLILGGTFLIMDRTGGIAVVIKRLVARYQHNKYQLLRMTILIFMLFGSLFGIFEESMAMMPIMILLALSLGWDTLTGIGMSLMAAAFGFASAITNPFSVGVAANIAGIPILSGVWLRLVVFGLMYFIFTAFLTRHAKAVEKDPKRSLTYEIDQAKNRDFDLVKAIQYPNENVIFRSFMGMFGALIVVVLLISLLEVVAHISIPAIPVMALTFLVGAIIAGLRINKSWKTTLRIFGKGALQVAPVILLILLAAAVKFIITEAGIMDTILYELSETLSGQSPAVAILSIYLLVLVLQFFIGSASTKAILIMPILVPLVALIGISKELSILAFLFGDGFTNVIFPTNAVLLIALGVAKVPYQKWFRWTFPLQIVVLVMTAAILVFGALIGY
jgi:uncharacterized ion transporter superfamily protein YfcC